MPFHLLGEADLHQMIATAGLRITPCSVSTPDEEWIAPDDAEPVQSFTTFA